MHIILAFIGILFTIAFVAEYWILVLAALVLIVVSFFAYVIIKDELAFRRSTTRNPAPRRAQPFSYQDIRPMPSLHRTAPKRGLVIKEDPLNSILSGRKSLELRGKHNRQLGQVALIRKGSGLVFGVAEIFESIGPMDIDELRSRESEHAVEADRILSVFNKKWVYGWRLRNVVRLRSPVPYVHKGMSQVNLDPEAIAQIQLQLHAL